MKTVFALADGLYLCEKTNDHIAFIKRVRSITVYEFLAST